MIRFPDECFCEGIWAPVCGTDGKFYKNDCEASCAGTQIAKNLTDEDTPECDVPTVMPMPMIRLPDECFCEGIWAPVCGTDGKFYKNDCEALCAGTQVARNLTDEDAPECDVPTVMPMIRLPDECFCEGIWAPVCGTDGKFYKNDCEALCAGTQVAKNLTDEDTPECDVPTAMPMPMIRLPDDCFCEGIWAPVCGTDGKFYKNDCEALCAGTEVAKNLTDEDTPECGAPAVISMVGLPDDCFCEGIWAPVCGTDGKFYKNDCEASCAGTEVAKILTDDETPECGAVPVESMIRLPRECICGDIYAPVCGKDGKFYPNACEAKCAGTQVSKKHPKNGHSC